MLLGTACITAVVFFFSSRRRHTRLQGDWSSDVCSSDLAIRSYGWKDRHGCPVCHSDSPRLGGSHQLYGCRCTVRSEERRVGKECRSRRGEYLQKRKRNAQPTWTET